MRALVISDSHGRRSTLQDVVTICERDNAPDLIVHLGDFLLDAEYLRQRVRQQVLSVPGNCDWSDEGVERVVKLGGLDVLICHGHTLGVKMSLMRLAYQAQAKGVRAALFGHTHAPFMDYEQGVLLLNPGALQDERCAILEINQGEIRGELTNVNKLC